MRTESETQVGGAACCAPTRIGGFGREGKKTDSNHEAGVQGGELAFTRRRLRPLQSFERSWRINDTTPSAALTIRRSRSLIPVYNERKGERLTKSLRRVLDTENTQGK